MAFPQRIVIVGAGLGGAHTCLRLRDSGYDGEIIMLGAEEHEPYDRPPLSKAVLGGELDDTRLPHGWAELGVELLTGTAAAGLDTRARVVRAVSGDEIPYEALLIATGATAVKLPGEGEQLVLRTIDQALALRERLKPGARVAVVGASWIGAEVATAALARGCEVVCVEAGPEPLSQVLGAEAGALVRPWWDEIDLRTGTTVRSVDDGGLTLGDGTFVQADVVVTGVGVRPETSWLEGSGVGVDRGVLVDPWLCSSVSGVVAVGDAAAVQSRRFGTRLRTEHWDDALQGARVAAASLLRGDAEPGADDPVHDPVPYFWSNQFGHMLQYVGLHRPENRMVVRRADGVRGWSAGWFDEAGSLTALLAVDRPKDLVQARGLAGSGRPFAESLFADAAQPLTSAVAEPAR